MPIHVIVVWNTVSVSACCLIGPAIFCVAGFCSFDLCVCVCVCVGGGGGSFVVLFIFHSGGLCLMFEVEPVY